MIALDRLGQPDPDGHDVARRIWKFSTAPLPMITAYAEPADELDGMAAGACMFDFEYSILQSSPRGTSQFMPSQYLDSPDELAPSQEFVQ